MNIMNDEWIKVFGLYIIFLLISLNAFIFHSVKKRGDENDEIENAPFHLVFRGNEKFLALCIL